MLTTHTPVSPAFMSRQRSIRPLQPLPAPHTHTHINTHACQRGTHTKREGERVYQRQGKRLRGEDVREKERARERGREKERGRERENQTLSELGPNIQG